ncbi:hypothetical protein DP43_5012 [Burkholderia pseudomallei]|nr:hypothetical protein DP43_5012 [Burkholderia pseudomallei]
MNRVAAPSDRLVAQSCPRGFARAAEPVPRARMPVRQPPARAEQLRAQRRRAIVVLLVEAAILQRGHHPVDEIVERLGHDRARHVEAVDIRFVDPCGKLVRHLRRRADHRLIAAADRHLLEHAPHGPCAGRALLRDRVDGRLNRIGLHVRDRLVEAEAREIDAGRAREVREARLRIRVAPVFVELLARGPLVLVRHDRDAREDLDRRRIAADPRGGRADIGHRRARGGLALAVHEHAFGVLRGELDAARRRSGLIQHRRALRRRLAQMNRVDRVIRSVVAHAAHLVGPREHARGAVADHGVVVPAPLPELVDHFHVVVGARVAVVVPDLPREPHAARGAVEIARHDVPADAAFRQVIEGRHPPCEQVRRLVRQVRGHAEAEVLRHLRHRRHEQQRIVDGHLHRFAQREIGAAAVHVVDADDIREKDPVELAALERAREIGPVVEIGVLRGAVARVGPQAVIDMADAIHVERVQQDLFVRHRARLRFHHAIAYSRPNASSSACRTAGEC